jgi:hypothetical protein
MVKPIQKVTTNSSSKISDNSIDNKGAIPYQ